jgi:hypothetical protein
MVQRWPLSDLMSAATAFREQVYGDNHLGTASAPNTS